MTRITGGFKVMSWDERPYDDARGQPKLMQADVTYELLGDIKGEASIAYLMGYGTNGVASYVGLLRVTGAVSARDGSFVLQDIGTFENGVAKGRWTVLPGLGSGGLCGIQGCGQYEAGEGEARYSLDVSF